jgi:activator of HSP90 ATPase
MTHSIKIAVEIKCQADLVFELLTNPELISIWSGDEAQFENFAGGEVSLFGGWVSGKVLGIVQDKAVTFTWITSDWEEFTDSVVNYTLEANGTNTLLTIVHNGFPDISERDAHEAGWYDYVLNPIQEYLMGLTEYDE